MIRDSAWGKALGAFGETDGVIKAKVNLKAATFGGDSGFDKQHSAEFERNCQSLVSFYDEILVQLLLKERPSQIQ